MKEMQEHFFSVHIFFSPTRPHGRGWRPSCYRAGLPGCAVIYFVLHAKSGPPCSSLGKCDCSKEHNKGLLRGTEGCLHHGMYVYCATQTNQLAALIASRLAIVHLHTQCSFYHFQCLQPDLEWCFLCLSGITSNGWLISKQVGVYAGHRLAHQESIGRDVAGPEDHMGLMQRHYLLLLPLRLPHLKCLLFVCCCCRHGWWHSQGVICVAATLLAVADFYIKMPAVLVRVS